MAAPTEVTNAATAFNVATTPKSVSSVSVQTNDVITVLSITGNNLTTVGTPSDGANTYTLRQTVNFTDFTDVRVWTAVAAGNASLTIQAARGGSGGDRWGFDVGVDRGASVGASAQAHTTGAPSVSLTTTQDNSAVYVVVGDWTPVDGASRVWRTVNGFTPTSGNGAEKVYSFTSGALTCYVARYPDVGTAGAKTFGLSAPTGQKYSIAAIEIKGTASTDVTASDTPSGVRQGASTATGAVSVTFQDKSLGTREGSSSATGSVSVLSSDQPNGIRAGLSSASVTSDSITTDVSSGARLGISSESARFDVQYDDVSKGIRQGESLVSLVFDVVATDSPSGIREGKSPSDTSFLTPLILADFPSGVRLGSSGTDVTVDLVSQDTSEGLRLGSSEVTVAGSDLELSDISMGIRLGQSSANVTISAPLELEPTLHVSVGQRLFVRVSNEALQASVGTSLRSVVTEP